jgi:hypothetical protein
MIDGFLILCFIGAVVTMKVTILLGALIAITLIGNCEDLPHVNNLDDQSADDAIYTATEYFNSISYEPGHNVDESQAMTIIYLLLCDIKLREKQIEQNDKMIALIAGMDQNITHIARYH